MSGAAKKFLLLKNIVNWLQAIDYIGHIYLVVITDV